MVIWVTVVLTSVLMTFPSCIDLILYAASGQPIKVQVTTPDGKVKTFNGRGHTIFSFPDQSAFVLNSRYYLFMIPQKEEGNNPNL